MNNENYISEEAFEKLVNGLEYIERFTLYGRKGLKYHIKRLQEENKQLKEQQKEFIDYLEKEIVDSRAGSSQYYSAMQHLKLFKEIIGSDK